MIESVSKMLPKHVVGIIEAHLASDYLEEIRLRVDRPLELIVRGRPIFQPYFLTTEDAGFILNKLSHFSIYMIEEELKKGYVTIEGGHRVGLAGKVVTENGAVKVIRDVTSFNIRIAKEKLGIAERLVPHLYAKGSSSWAHTAIIGPPQSGKTTMIRDLARVISTGMADIEPMKVGIVDERSEIAGSVKGVPQHTFGSRLDVLDACPKAEGMMMMIRSMSPDVLVVDEVGRMEDCEAVLEAMNAGVKVIMTVHGTQLDDLLKRPSLSSLMNAGVFERFLVLTAKNGAGTIQGIYDKDFTALPLSVLEGGRR